MLMLFKKRRSAIRTLRAGRARCCRTPGAIRECEEHGWMLDRGDRRAREQAIAAARPDPAPGVSPEKAVAEVRDVLDSIGDTCPECPPTCLRRSCDRRCRAESSPLEAPRLRPDTAARSLDHSNPTRTIVAIQIVLDAPAIAGTASTRTTRKNSPKRSSASGS
jgi:hypothetical protein